MAHRNWIAPGQPCCDECTRKLKRVKLIRVAVSCAIGIPIGLALMYHADGYINWLAIAPASMIVFSIVYMVERIRPN